MAKPRVGLRKIGLAVYQVKVRNLSTGDYELLGKMGSGVDFFEMLHAYFADRSAAHSVDDIDQTVLRAREPLFATNRIIRGRIEAGSYGAAQDLIDHKTGKKTYRKGVDEAPMMPMYFRFEIPVHLDEGVVILQKSGQHGIKTQLENDLRRWMTEKWPAYRASIQPLAPADAWERFIAPSRVTKVRLIHYVGKSDRADMLGIDHIEEFESVEVVLKAKRRMGVKSILGSLHEHVVHRKVTNLIAIENFEYDDAKIEFALGRGRYTLDVNRPEDISVPYDASERVTLDPDGHPDFASIDNFADELQTNVRKALKKKADDG